MLRSFSSKETEKIWQGVRSHSLPNEIQRITRRKSRMINNARDINDLRIPPGNKLERLTHDRVGQHSIHINRQWRICFTWKDGDAYDVEIVDHH
jgi:toxin HigB-1